MVGILTSLFQISSDSIGWQSSSLKFQSGILPSSMLPAAKRMEKMKISDAVVRKTPLNDSQWSQSNTKMLQKRSNTQRLRTDLGRSVEATTVIQPVWLTKDLRVQLSVIYSTVVQPK